MSRLKQQQVDFTCWQPGMFCSFTMWKIKQKLILQVRKRKFTEVRGKMDVL